MIKTKIIFLLFAVSLCLSGEINFNERVNRFGLGLRAGYGNPYGFGPEIVYILKNRWDVHLGFGLNLAGPAMGGGTRINILNGAFRPFMGTDLVFHRKTDLSISSGGATAEYQLPDEVILHLQAGIQFFIRSHLLILGTGYGFSLPDKANVLISGTENTQIADILKKVSPGGAEISLTYLFAF